MKNPLHAGMWAIVGTRDLLPSRSRPTNSAFVPGERVEVVGVLNRSSEALIAIGTRCTWTPISGLLDSEEQPATRQMEIVR